MCNMLKLLVFIFGTSTQPIEKFEPCEQDFSSLSGKKRVELSLACSKVDGQYASFYRTRMEIWKNGKRI